MSDRETGSSIKKPVDYTSSEEFTRFCDAEFERRLNSGTDFDEPRYQQAMALVMQKLRRLEDGDGA